MSPFELFLDQYYLYISLGLFFAVYTGLLIYSNIAGEQNLDPEDYAISFIIIALACVGWVFIIPVLCLILLGYLYIKGVNWISQVYIKRSRNT